MIAPGEVSPKVTLFQEPMVYLKPVIAYSNPIPQIAKTYSNDNYFNQEAYKEFKNARQSKNSDDSTKKEFTGKGAILDILA